MPLDISLHFTSLSLALQVMRPSYQKYHEVRGELDALQSAIEKKYGLIPLFTDEGGEGEKGAHGNMPGMGSGSGTVSGQGDNADVSKPGTETLKTNSLSVTSTDPFSSFLFKSTGTTPYSAGPVPPIER